LNRIGSFFGYVALAFFADLLRVRFRERKTIATTLIRKGSRLMWTGERIRGDLRCGELTWR